MKIRRDHVLGKDEARSRVDEVAAAIGDKYGLRSSWNGDSLEFGGTGVDGRIAVGDQAVDVEVSLGFALMMLEPTIRTSIEEALDKYLS